MAVLESRVSRSFGRLDLSCPCSACSADEFLMEKTHRQHAAFEKTHHALVDANACSCYNVRSEKPRSKITKRLDRRYKHRPSLSPDGVITE